MFFNKFASCSVPYISWFDRYQYICRFVVVGTYEPYKLLKTAISCNVIIACSLSLDFSHHNNNVVEPVLKRKSLQIILKFKNNKQ